MAATAPQPLPAEHLRDAYPRDIERIAAVITLHTSVRAQFHAARALQWTNSPRARPPDSYLYARGIAIELARELAGRFEPTDLPLLWTAIADFVPRGWSNRISRQRLLDAKRASFLELFRWELEAHPLWPM